MEHKIYKSYDELPLMLSVQNVADVLGISISGAYELVKEKDFPCLRIGARIVVPKEKFIKEIILYCQTRYSTWISRLVKSRSMLF